MAVTARILATNPIKLSVPGALPRRREENPGSAVSRAAKFPQPRARILPSPGLHRLLVAAAGSRSHPVPAGGAEPSSHREIFPSWTQRAGLLSALRTPAFRFVEALDCAGSKLSPAQHLGAVSAAGRGGQLGPGGCGHGSRPRGSAEPRAGAQRQAEGQGSALQNAVQKPFVTWQTEACQSVLWPGTQWGRLVTGVATFSSPHSTW